MKIKLKVKMSHHSSSSLVLQTYAPFSSCALLYPTFYLRIFKTRENNCRNPDILEISDFERFYFRIFFLEWQKFLSVTCPTMPREVTLKIFSENMAGLEKLLWRMDLVSFLLSCSGIWGLGRSLMDVFYLKLRTVGPPSPRIFPYV